MLQADESNHRMALRRKKTEHLEKTSRNRLFLFVSSLNESLSKKACKLEVVRQIIVFH